MNTISHLFVPGARTATTDRLRLAERQGDAVAVRASAVSWRGEALVLPGPTGTGVGTRTLLRALVDAGAEPLCTDYALIRPDGTIIGFPETTSTRGLPLTLVATLVFAPEGGWNVRLSSTGHTVLALVDQAVEAQGRTRHVMDHVLAAVPRSTAVSGTRGEARDAARRILGSWRTAG